MFGHRPVRHTTIQDVTTEDHSNKSICSWFRFACKLYLIVLRQKRTAGVFLVLSVVDYKSKQKNLPLDFDV